MKNREGYSREYKKIECNVYKVDNASNECPDCFAYTANEGFFFVEDGHDHSSVKEITEERGYHRYMRIAFCECGSIFIRQYPRNEPL